MEKNEKAENELIFLDDLIGWVGEKNARIPKILLKCLNCGYKDVLSKMLKPGMHMDSNVIVPHFIEKSPINKVGSERRL